MVASVYPRHHLTPTLHFLIFFRTITNMVAFRLPTVALLALKTLAVVVQAAEGVTVRSHILTCANNFNAGTANVCRPSNKAEISQIILRSAAEEISSAFSKPRTSPSRLLPCSLMPKSLDLSWSMAGQREQSSTLRTKRPSPSACSLLVAA